MKNLHSKASLARWIGGAGTGPAGLFLLFVSIVHQFAAVEHYTHSVQSISVAMAIAIDWGFVSTEGVLWYFGLRNIHLRACGQKGIGLFWAWAYLVVAMLFSAAMNFWGFTHDLQPFSQDWWVSSALAVFIPFGVFCLSKLTTLCFAHADIFDAEAQSTEQVASGQPERRRAVAMAEAGTANVLTNGKAPDPTSKRSQRRLEEIQRTLAEGGSLTVAQQELYNLLQVKAAA